jgi:hypothetical protein
MFSIALFVRPIFDPGSPAKCVHYIRSGLKHRVGGYCLRQALDTPGMQVILTRNFVFSLFIAAVPALVPVVALQHLRLQASHLGLVFTSMGIGSLLGGTLILPYARAKASPNTVTILAGVPLVIVLVLMSIVPNLWMFLPVTALAGISWTVKASELWIAGQRAMPDWARGRMNAVNLMASQGGVALGGVLWGGKAARQMHNMGGNELQHQDQQSD